VAQEAEGYFLKAIAIARRQRAKSFELRAVMSLCKLRQLQGREESARQSLGKIHDWFKEGSNTPDLQAARQLLAELTRPATPTRKAPADDVNMPPTLSTAMS
jgi:predicted ATPase